MKLATAAATAYVVRGRGPGARIVAIFWGSDAADEARTWIERGYRVDPVDRALLDTSFAA